MADVNTCPECQTVGEFRHLHDEAHGISGTHMAGSERYECAKCGYAIFTAEGKKLGMKFILDKG